MKLRASVSNDSAAAIEALTAETFPLTLKIMTETQTKADFFPLIDYITALTALWVRGR